MDDVDHAGDLEAACGRAFATLRRALVVPRMGEPGVVDEDAARVAHARTLVMIGRPAQAHAVLRAGGLTCAIERMFLWHADDDLEAAIAVGRAAADDFPDAAPGFRNSVAGMLSALGRHREALELIEQNRAAQPDVEGWAELAELLHARIAVADAVDAAAATATATDVDVDANANATGAA